MSGRLRTIAAANEQIATDGEYTTDDGVTVVIGPALEAAMAGTVSHPPDGPLDVPPPAGTAGHIDTPPGTAGHPPGVPRAGHATSDEVPPRAGHATSFEVTAEGSLEGARRLYLAGSGRIAVLNFASARNPGGGYVGGAKAQEEDLCRNALLYPCLLRAPDYYAAHRASTDLLYSHRVIWSPDVPAHRDTGGRLLAEPYQVSFLTSPAPNAGEALRRDPELKSAIPRVLHERAGRVLAVAAHHGARRLVLGAWGCGVFRNDPREVAEAFHARLTGEFAGVFEHVLFAVWDRTRESANRAAFEERFR